MKIVKQSFEILSEFDRTKALKTIELAARTCYKSECNITEDSASDFVRKIAQVRKHESCIEHYSVTVKFICDRGISHELVRHRLASFSQESTRYCNYSKDKFNNEITIICPEEIFKEKDSNNDLNSFDTWFDAMHQCELSYINLLKLNISPQIARSVLPNALKTEIVITANLREWKHIFKMRTAKAAHPQMRELMIPLFNVFKNTLPEIYDDIVI